MTTGILNNYVDSKINFIKGVPKDSFTVPVINKQAAEKIVNKLPGYTTKIWKHTISIKKIHHEKITPKEQRKTFDVGKN